MLLDSRNISKHDYSSLQYLIYSAAPMSVERLKQALSVFGPVMAQTFGQAEAPFFCAILTPQDHVLEEGIQSRRLASCGRATPFTRDNHAHQPALQNVATALHKLQAMKTEWRETS